MPLLLCTRERCFWSSALHGEMEQEWALVVAVLTPSNVSVGPWEYLLKIRLEYVLTTLTTQRYLPEMRDGLGPEIFVMAGWRGSAPRLGWLCCHRRCRAATATPSHSPIVHRSVPGRIVILSQPSSTGVLPHPAGDVKALGSRHTAGCWLVGGQVPHALPSRAWAAAMLESWLQHPQLTSKCREVLA